MFKKEMTYINEDASHFFFGALQDLQTIL